MDIEGTYTLQTTPEGAWQCLMDTEILPHALPGLDHLERLSEDTYALAMHIQQAPLIGAYHGHLTITERHYPYYYCIEIEGEGQQSKIHGSGVIHLNGRGENTVVAYKGTLHLGRIGSLLPPPVVKGAAKMFIQQYFTALTEQMRAMNLPRAISSEGGDLSSDARMPPQQLEHAMNLPPQEQRQLSTIASSYPYLLIRLLHLGRGDPRAEEQWATRIRRTGIVTVLLVLVWIGTRLPRNLPQGTRKP